MGYSVSVQKALSENYHTYSQRDIDIESLPYVKIGGMKYMDKFVGTTPAATSSARDITC